MKKFWNWKTRTVKNQETGTTNGVPAKSNDFVGKGGAAERLSFAACDEANGCGACDDAERTLYLNGTIAEESWFDDDVTPQLFKEELMSGSGDITVWINSPGGDCVAAAQIYNMRERYVTATNHEENVTKAVAGV